MALFGAPVAHEDDPERAVRASLAIRDWAFEEDDVQVRIAVTTGEALIRLDARPEMGEGMASGDVVNTAARLQSAAPVNGVLADETTYRATRQVIEYREAPPVDAKGKVEPIPVWEAATARSRFGVDVAHEARAELVGRERELGVLHDAFERARHERTPQLVTLVGIPGIGKSRLVYELRRIVDADPELITWRQGRCLAYGEGVTLWALGEITKAQAGILEQDVPDEVVTKLAEMARKSRVGHPLDEATMIGPVVDEGQLATVMGYIDKGRAEGATLVAGGDRLTDGPLADGYYIAPTVFDDVSSSMAIGREEIFGPVLSVFTFDDAADAVRQANDSMYGLAAAIWTSDLDTAIGTAKGVKAGTVWVNAYHDAGMAFVLPMGGYKASGNGRELGREGLDEYFETKSIHIHLAGN
jgi:hypothetical protein